ncbi:MAG: hypothetical protein IJS09_10160, partial [Treponema sp.]|nr:hypothetical protein [Treponema sp.]
KRKCLAHLSVQERQAVLEEETSLQDEINELVKFFQESFKENLPDPTPALSLPFVDSTNEGLIIGDDSIIPFNSVQGAMTVEILNAVAEGENIKDLLTSFQSEINQEYEISERCLWTTDKNAWPNGDVYYRWGTILPNHKTSVIEAMCIWYTKTLGTITFHELADNSWNNFLLFLGLIGCVNISDDFLDENVLGVSTVGYQGGFQTLKLSWQIQENMLKATCCHELGHTLGLRHEHQRPDRDFYISVPYVGSNFNPFPKEIDGFRWNSFTIDLFFFSITIYYPIWWSETYSETEGLFDFDSVMLYSGFPVHEQWQTFNHNKTMTQQQSEPSPFDVYMIMKQY